MNRGTSDNLSVIIVGLPNFQDFLAKPRHLPLSVFSRNNGQDKSNSLYAMNNGGSFEVKQQRKVYDLTQFNMSPGLQTEDRYKGKRPAQKREASLDSVFP